MSSYILHEEYKNTMQMFTHKSAMS